MKTLFESQLDLFTNQTRTDIVEWQFDKKITPNGKLRYSSYIQTKDSDGEEINLQIEVEANTYSPAQWLKYSYFQFKLNTKHTESQSKFNFYRLFFTDEVNYIDTQLDPNWIDNVKDKISWNKAYNLPPQLVDEIGNILTAIVKHIIDKVTEKQ